MRISIQPNTGKIPRLSDQQLASNIAQVATNCDFDRGFVKPIKQTSDILTIPGATGAARTIYKLGTKWICWPADVDVIRAQVADSASSHNRILTAGDNITDSAKLYPKITDTEGLNASDGYVPTTVRRLGVQAPDPGGASGGLGLGVQGTGDGKVVATVCYVYTGVDEFGHESAISAVSPVEDVQGGQYVALNNFILNTLVATGNDIKYFRVYRASISASGGVSYRLTKVRPLNTAAAAVYDLSTTDINGAAALVFDCNDDVTGLSLEQDSNLMTELWTHPPDGLSGLVQFQNNITAGFVGKKVYLSVTGYYYAFPEDYAIALDYDVVALGAYNETLIAATSGYPYVITGDSEAPALKRIEDLQPCRAKRSLVATPTGVYYASNDGLVWSDGYQAKVVTLHLFTPDQWKALGPENIIAAYFKGKYIAFFQGTKTGFSIAIDQELPCVIGFDTSNDKVYGLHVCAADDALYLLTYDDADYHIEKWAGSATDATFTWESGDIVTIPWIFSVARLIGDFAGGKTVTLSILVDGVQKATKTVSSKDWFYIPAYALSAGQGANHSFKVSGTASIETILIANTPLELFQDDDDDDD